MDPGLSEPRLRKLNFRAWRRGFREADLIVGGFAAAELARMTDEELDAFERLLEVPDGELYDWIVERAEPAPEHDGPVMHRLREFRFLVSGAPSTTAGG